MILYSISETRNWMSYILTLGPLIKTSRGQNYDSVIVSCLLFICMDSRTPGKGNSSLLWEHRKVLMGFLTVTVVEWQRQKRRRCHAFWDSRTQEQSRRISQETGVTPVQRSADLGTAQHGGSLSLDSATRKPHSHQSSTKGSLWSHGH